VSAGRTISLIAWAAIIAAWALPPTVQKSSGFASVPDNGLNHSSDVERVQEHAAAHPIGDAELVDHLGEELLPGDYTALANPNMRGLLPPVEFAHPYRGRVLLLQGQSQEALRRICGKQPEGALLLGCARRPDTSGVPFVVLADEATVRANGWTPNLNMLHEAGHLNGSWGHDGWRNLAQLGAPKPIIVAQADAAEDVPLQEHDAYRQPPPPPRRHSRPRYHEPPVYGPPPGWIVIPSEQRAVPCLPTLMTLGLLRFCI